MSETTGRLLAVLAALQSRPFWSGPELAAHLGVTVRTVRRDVDRLRQLGYPIDSDAGSAGGYRLGVGGSAVPPLMLDTDEVFALAVLTRAADGQGIGDAAQRAIAKLEQMLPSHLRRDIALSSTVIRVRPPIDDVDSAVLRTVSAACRASDELAVTYRDRNGRVTERRLLPHRVVSIGRRWYLVARDARHDDWRTWRVDRIESARTDRAPVRRDRPTRRGGARPAIDQHRSLPAPGAGRARRSGRAHRRDGPRQRRRAGGDRR